MKQYRVRMEEGINKNGAVIDTKYYPEYRYKFFGLFPFWLCFESEDEPLYFRTFERAINYLEPLINADNNKIHSTNIKYYPINASNN